MTQNPDFSFTALMFIPSDSDHQKQVKTNIWDKLLSSGAGSQLQWTGAGNPEHTPKWFTGQWIPFANDDDLAGVLAKAFSSCKTTHLLFINNYNLVMTINQSVLDLIQLSLKRSPNAGLVYGDYDLIGNSGITPVRLLKHHTGRVRDNQDYGRLFCFNVSAIQKAGGVNRGLRFHPLYDLLLKISEQNELVHIANKFLGSLYSLAAPKQDVNVFDYLMEEKGSQLEAEEIATEHLKRIGAYLAPGDYFQKRPQPMHNPDLKASIIIPVNQRPEFIGTALESCLQQTEQDIEVIVVVNGGAEDSTIPEIKRYQQGGDKYRENAPRVQFIVVDINNIGFCINTGVDAARGEYYVQLDSDDRLKPQAVADIINVFEADSDTGMVIGSYDVWEKQDDGSLVRKAEIPTVTHDEWTPENGRNNLLRIGGAGAPRAIAIQVIKNIGYFSMNEDPYSRNYAEDYELVLRISEKYRTGRIYHAIYDVIRHPGGTDHNIDQETIDRNDEAKDWMRKAAIERRIKLNLG